MHQEDHLILSKGHAAAALYTVLAQKGVLNEADLETYYQEGTLLAAHPPCGGQLAGITFGTGSLGHGLSLATGLALSTKFTRKDMRVYCVLSDGDLNEGSTWEAILFAAQHKLNNLCVIVDNNGLQGFGKSTEVLNMEPLFEKLEAFNFEVTTAANGNDFNDLNHAFKELDAQTSNKPRCIIAKTTKGSGVAFMEDRLEWHYLPMTDEQYALALKLVEKNYAQ